MTVPRAGRSATRHELIVADLRADILGGRLLPGERLPFAPLCARFSASVGVVREALMRLVEQGLVQSEPQLGVRVVPVSVEDLSDLTEARLELETLALRRAVEEADVEWEGRVLAAHHALTRSPQADPEDPRGFSEDWARSHAEFHKVLLDGCPNRRLRAVAATLRDSAELYRRWSRSVAHDDDRDIAGEHRALLDAVLARDADGAVTALSKHIAHTTQVLLEIVEPGDGLVPNTP